MRLTEKEYCWLIEDFFPGGVVAGFTKPILNGELPRDLQKALAFLNRELDISFLNQRHSAVVNLANEPGVYEGDGLFTQLYGNVLAIKTADCFPILFSDRSGSLVGAVHMGWRSAKDRILENIFCSRVSLAAFGVGLRKCCYHVGDDFATYSNMAKFLVKKENRICFDPVSFARAALVDYGFAEKDCVDVDMCSFCSGEQFHSYRKNKTGMRTISFIVRS